MKIGLVSLGCPKNLVDSEVMLGLARDAGHELTADPSRADVIIVNTCAFIDSAKQESIDAILEMAEHKKSGACRRLVVTGCLAERYRSELRAEIAEIDAVLGTGEVPHVVRAIAGDVNLSAPLRFYCPSAPNQAPASSTTHPAASTKHLHLARGTRHQVPSTPGSRPTYIYDAQTPRILTTPRHLAYIKIAEGCDYKCSFCIIPSLRGGYRSRPADSIVMEARTLAARGVKEILLVSQDTTFYGVDRRERGALAGLLRALNKIDGLEWIRLLYLYPTTIDDMTLAAMAESEKVCKYIDLPLQHASDPVLKDMKRPGTRQHYERLLDRIRDRVPNVALRTTFIVGFPGETDANVDELCDFVRDQRFDHLGVFTYSHEEGTSAFTLADTLSAGEKEERRLRVMAVQREVARTRNRSRIGATAMVMVDGPSHEHELVLKARLSTQAPDIDPVVFLTECDPSALTGGDVVEVAIVDANDYDLVARPVIVQN